MVIFKLRTFRNVVAVVLMVTVSISFAWAGSTIPSLQEHNDLLLWAVGVLGLALVWFVKMDRDTFKNGMNEQNRVIKQVGEEMIELCTMFKAHMDFYHKDK